MDSTSNLSISASTHRSNENIYIYIDFFYVDNMDEHVFNADYGDWTRIKGFYANDVTRDEQ